ncbi:MAG: hypothetical protein QOI31_2152 [Solirubrobacterales bacterium]|jgi:hypothetical protein|nr:hypothetical protein [Solirubrobacterales bacterium]
MNNRHDSGGGWLGWLIGICIVIAAVVYGVSGLGHLLGLTPTGTEVFDSEDGWISKHYEGVAVGYVLTVLVVAFLVGSFFLWRSTKANEPEQVDDVLKGLGTVGVFLAILVMALPVGARETVASDDGDDHALASSRSASKQHSENRADERADRLAEQLAKQRQAQREAQRERQREKAEAAEKAEEDIQQTAAVQPAASNCDSNYSGACLDPNSPDYDCEGGSGDGPDYTGPVTVVGNDHYGLDTSDGDPAACEPY